jgi:hypothetical protein
VQEKQIKHIDLRYHYIHEVIQSKKIELFFIEGSENPADLFTKNLGCINVTVSPSPQSKDEENEKLHELRRYARDFRRQHTTDAEQFDWDSDDGDYGLAIGRLVVT